MFDRRPNVLIAGALLAVATIASSAGRTHAQGAPGPNKADEPLADKLSLQKAGEFLDRAALAWHKSKKCASCHTTYPYLIARTMIGDDDAPAYAQLRKFLQDRVDAWDNGGRNA